MHCFLLGLLAMNAAALPAGPAPEPVAMPHFPDRLHACVWRSWPLVPVKRLAETIGATPEQIMALGKGMGLPDPPAIGEGQSRRSYITIIRANWHLLPYEQLVRLLGWTSDQLAYTLREDDFLFVKLGSLKPRCEPLNYTPPDKQTLAREREIAEIVRENFPDIGKQPEDPLFGFVRQLSAAPPERPPTDQPGTTKFSPCFCYSYFALYGDPLLDPETDPFPDGYLARLAEVGVDGVWLPGVLYKLTPFPWDESLSGCFQERLNRLRELVERAKRRNIGVYLYLNEPRSMPLAFFEQHPELKGVVEGEQAALCTSVPAVRDYVRDGVAAICRAAPNLAGIFTITASENLTHCWSHNQGKACPRCGRRSPEEVIADLNTAIHEGIAKAGNARTKLIAWDWGWRDPWAERVIDRLPAGTALMSVSEWSLPLRRGGVESIVGEYSISAIGPGPRAKRQWDRARGRGMETLAKIQANNTWELSAVPYIPAVENVARHAANLRSAGVSGMMLGWTLGGYPSPNLEVVAELGRSADLSPGQAMERVARRRFGAELAPAVVNAWHVCSVAFQEFPYSCNVLYRAPLQMGPANLFWEKATGYTSSMVGIPYDDLDHWRDIYPPETFIAQFMKMADGFDSATLGLRQAAQGRRLNPQQARALAGELDVTEVCAIHFRSVANQARFVLARRALEAAKTKDDARQTIGTLEETIESEMDLAKRLYAIQRRDSRIGFEATNQYYYVPLDLVEKVVNCNDLLSRWLPAERARRKL